MGCDIVSDRDVIDEPRLAQPGGDNQAQGFIARRPRLCESFCISHLDVVNLEPGRDKRRAGLTPDGRRLAARPERRRRVQQDFVDARRNLPLPLGKIGVAR